MTMTTTGNKHIPMCFMSVNGTLSVFEKKVKFPADTQLVFNIFCLAEEYQTSLYKKFLKIVPKENILLITPQAVNKNYPGEDPRNVLVVWKPLKEWLGS